MIGLLLKDLLNLKKVVKQYLLILAAMSVWAYFAGNPGFVCMYVVLCSAMLVLTSFSYDEYAHFEKYALTMPIGKKTLVQEKYLLLLLTVVGGTVLGLGTGALMNLALNQKLSEILIMGLGVGCVFLVSYSLVLPMIFKNGVEKARLTMVGIYVVMFLAVYAMAKLLSAGRALEVLARLEHVLPVIILAVVLGIFAGSYRISLKIIERKEW